jgi:hypothetical protein
VAAVHVPLVHVAVGLVTADWLEVLPFVVKPVVACRSGR